MPDDLRIPFPPDSQQQSLMAQIVDSENCTIASEGTDRYELFDVLAEGGYLSKTHCPEALGVYQFNVTIQGMETLA